LISNPSENKATHEVAFCFLLNQLLEREAWARQKLAPFAGERVEWRAPPLPAVRFTILEGGRVAAGGEGATLTVTLKPGAAVALLRGEDYFMREVEVSGNARLAAEVLALARHLRWDFEEDLSRVVGDVAAHRLADAARALAAWQADATRRVAEAFAGYATEEKRLLVRRAELGALSDGIAGLRDGVERLAKRIERL
jgi:ubiquinone biosynthesis protein UbiJ